MERLRIGKGDEDEAHKLGRMAIDNSSNTLEQGEGKCIWLTQAYQKAFETTEQNHSLFTHYLLEGLKGKQAEAVNEEGFVTPDSLSNSVSRLLWSLGLFCFFHIYAPLLIGHY